MKNIVTIMQGMPGFCALSGASVEEIARAEEELGVLFANDYRSYVETLGVASFEGHELTGVCKPKRLHVVEVTKEERAQNESISTDWYVLEQTHIDGIVVWQSSDGSIYQSIPGGGSKKIYDSLEAYISGM